MVVLSYEKCIAEALCRGPLGTKNTDYTRFIKMLSKHIFYWVSDGFDKKYIIKSREKANPICSVFNF